MFSGKHTDDRLRVTDSLRGHVVSIITVMIMMMAHSCDPFTPPLPGAVKFFIVPAGERARVTATGESSFTSSSPPPYFHHLIFLTTSSSPSTHLHLLIPSFSSSPPPHLHHLLFLITSSLSPPRYFSYVFVVNMSSTFLCCSSAPPPPATPSSFLLLLLFPLLSPPPSLLSRMLGLVLLWFCSFGLLRLSSSLVHGNVPLDEGPGTGRHVESSYLSEGGESSCPITALALTCHRQVNTPVLSAMPHVSEVCLAGFQKLVCFCLVPHREKPRPQPSA